MSGGRTTLSNSLRVGLFLSGSKEYDYDSFGFGGDIAGDSDDKNTTVKFSLNGFFDRVTIIRWNGKEDEGEDDRVSFSSSLNWYQVISPTAHGELGTTISYQSGFLETAFNSVVLEDPTFLPDLALHNNAQGIEVQEELPVDRIRGVVFGRLRKFIKPRSSIELYGRIYADSWGINSFTAKPQFQYWFIEDSVSLGLQYRYYIQTEADDFKDHFSYAADRGRPFLTQDSDLGDFDAHSVGSTPIFTYPTISHGISPEIMFKEVMISIKL